MEKGGRGKRRRVSDEYKAEALRLVGESGKRVGTVARELGLGETALRCWVLQQAEINAGRGPTRALTTSEREELGAVTARESALAHGARNPKKSDGLHRQGERVRFAFIVAEKACFPVALMCRILAVSRAGFYAWRRRPVAARTREDLVLAVAVAAIYAEHHGRYGSPRVRMELRERGRRSGRKRIARLMRAQGLRARPKRRYRTTTDSRHGQPVRPNLLARRFRRGPAQ